jgi:hypothetical protein
MPSSWMLRRVTLVSIHVSDGCIASVNRVKRIIEAILSTETSVLARATRHHIAGEGTLHSNCCDNVKSYIIL